MLVDSILPYSETTMEEYMHDLKHYFGQNCAFPSLHALIMEERSAFLIRHFGALAQFVLAYKHSS